MDTTANQVRAHARGNNGLIVIGWIEGDDAIVDCVNERTLQVYRDTFPASRLGHSENLRSYCEAILAQWQHRIGRGLDTPWSEQAA